MPFGSNTGIDLQAATPLRSISPDHHPLWFLVLETSKTKFPSL